MPSIDVDFETFKHITMLRPSEDVTECDVIRWKLGLPSPIEPIVMDDPSSIAAVAVNHLPMNERFWTSEGVKFRVGDELRHWFRGTTIPAVATITESGLFTDGKNYSSLSAAAIHHTGHSCNGWRFWNFLGPDGQWKIAEQLRS